MKNSKVQPLSYAQRALWFLQRLAPTSTAYNLNYTVRVENGPAGDFWRRAFQRLTDRHAALRTTYPMVDGQPVQRIHEHRTVDFRDIDATSWSDAQVDELLSDEAGQAFDLEQGPVVSVRLLRRSPDSVIFFFHVHHIAVDVPSIALLFEELRLLMLEELGLGAADLADPTADPGDFGSWEEELLAGPEGTRLWRYWRRRLTGLPELDLPTDRPRPHVRQFRGDVWRFEFRDRVRAGVLQLAEARGVDPGSILLAAFQAVLARMSGQDDLVVGWAAPGRSEERFQDVVGYFVNPLLMRADLADDPTLDRFFTRTASDCEEALAHQALPFPWLVERLAPGRDLDRSPLYQVLLAYYRDDNERLRWLFSGDQGVAVGPARLIPVSVPHGGAILDLSLNLVDAGGVLSAVLEYDRDLFDDTTIRRLADQLERLLAVAASDTDGSMSELDLLSPAQRHQVTVEWCPPAVEHGVEAPVGHRLRVLAADGSPSPIGVEGEVHAVDDGSAERPVGRRGRFLADGRLEMGAALPADGGLPMDGELSADGVDESLHPQTIGLLDAFDADARRYDDGASELDNGLEDGDFEDDEADGVAVIGLAGRFPGAADVAEFWDNLCGGVESIRQLDDDELRAAGVSEDELNHADYVPASAVLDDIELFDAGFFGFNARDAALLDPQQRLFLESSWQALEDAGIDPETFDGDIGVFAGGSANTYFMHYFLRHNAGAASGYHTLIGNDKDFLTTRVSYKLGLTGPSINVQTACSSSLVAVHLASQSLLNGECDVVLAGGVSISVPQRQGYLYSPGGIMSPDGHCRSFDARAKGTVGGSGVGVVVLKRLDDALADGDRIRAVIRGTAVNNDGSFKAGYTAPGVRGQARVITDALAMAGVEPESVGYVEGHGSATHLGDTIEVAALTRAFRGVPQGTCGLGSVKSNIGHLDAAAGVTGLIKTVMAVEHGEIPPSLNFDRPNPRLKLGSGPFYVNDRRRAWPIEGPRRAGVSSFGLGGTNAHVVLEEAPSPEPSSEPRSSHLLVLSARTSEALEAATDRLAQHLEEQGEVELADVAFTTQVGRRAFVHRRVLTASTPQEAAAALVARDPRRVLDGVREMRNRPVAFLFPGLGEHYPGMARGLYQQMPGFRRRLDRCAEILRPILDLDLREPLFAAAEKQADASAGPNLRAMLGRSQPASTPTDGPLARTALAQPAMFAIEFALAGLWREVGIRPQAMVGYSLGEYVAACAAGVMPLEDALRLVARRAQAIDALPTGSMLAVPLAEAALRRRLKDPATPEGLSIAAVNGPELSVLSGPPEAVEAMRSTLDGEGHACRPLRTTHAFHSTMMEPVADELRQLLDDVELSPPEIPYLSNVSGDWITAAQATDREYWVRHLLEPVRFADAARRLWREPGRLLLEVGPGQSLTSLALQLAEDRAAVAVPSLPSAYESQDDFDFLLRSLGRLWLSGCQVDWPRFYGDERRQRVALPTYPFERQRYGFEEPAGAPSAVAPATASPSPGAMASPAVESAGAVAEPRTTVQARPSNLANPYAAPRSRREHLLADLWQELLGVDQVGIHDSFFELGGHSLLATQVLARLREQTGASISLEKIFEVPTIEGLAALLPADGTASAGALESAGEPVPEIPRRPEDSDAPLAYAQQRLWFLDRLEPGLIAYNNPSVLRLRGELDVAALAAAFDELRRRHEVLRTHFVDIDGEGRQRIEPFARRPQSILDLGRLEAADRERHAKRLAEWNIDLPFDLATDDLMRSCLIRLNDEEHLLALTLHHIVSDEWSNGILVRELAILYQAFGVGQPSPLPELPIQYADYALWQRQRMQGEVLEGLLSFWREHLEGAPEVLDLPTDRPRPATQSFRGGHRTFEVGAETEAALQALAGKHDATLFMVLMSAFQALLLRLTGQRDLVVGFSRGVRERVEVETLIGCFANVLPLRGQPRGDDAFGDLLDQVQRSMLSSYPHQDLPFDLLVKELQRERDPSLNPIFQVLLVLLNVPQEALEVHGLTFRGVELERQGAQFDLSLYVNQDTTHSSGGRLVGYMEYDSALFDGVTIERWLSHWTTLLEALAADPNRSLAELPSWSAAERHQLLVEWNDTDVAATGACLHQLIAEQAASNPEALAVVADVPGAKSLTYGELLAAAHALAHQLQALGAGPEALVGIHAERSPELMVALLAVLEVGAAYVPLDPSYPRRRLANVAADCGLTVLLEQPHLEALQGTFQRLELAPSVVDARASAAPSPRADASHPAYVIYTSGSTGRPKGAVNSHRAIVNRLRWMQATYRLDASDRVLQKTPISFDVSVWELFWPLLTGARLVLARPEGHRDPAYLASAIERHDITTLHFVPSMLEAFLNQPELGELPSLRRVIASGEALPRDLERRFFERLDARLDNLYGPTEAAIDVSWWRCLNEAEETMVPLGRPIDGTALHVLDRDGRPAPMGVAGELCIGGVALARGYHLDPARTAASFMPESVTEGRLYRTGDRARWRADGHLEFLGRLDHQVKIRGFRVELGEIEARLAEHPAVRACTSIVTPATEDSPPRLVAYWVSAGEIPEDAALRDFLIERLPDPMVPDVFVQLETLPQTASGKVDRRALPAPQPAQEADHEPPNTREEIVLADLWRRLLGVQQVGRNDSFFALGGDSIVGIQLVSRARQAGLGLTPQQIFRHPTLSALASVTETVATGAIARGPVVGPVPLTPMARWLLDLDLPTPEHWNQAVFLHLKAKFVAALPEAVTRLTAHHDALRLRLEPHADGWRGNIVALDVGDVAWSRIDLSGLADEQFSAVTEQLAAAAQASLELQSGPLVRWLVFASGEECRLLVVAHHLTVDGVSWRVLLEDLILLLESITEGATPSLPPGTTPFRDWARALPEHIRSSSVADSFERWMALLDRPVPSLLSSAAASASNLESSARSVTTALEASQTQQLLREAVGVYGTGIDDFLLAALTRAVAVWTGEPILRLDLETHGRQELIENLDLSRTVGWFTGIYPLALDLRSSSGPGETLRTVRDQRQSVPDEGLSYGLLRYLDVGSKRSEALAALPPSELIFNYLGVLDRLFDDGSPIAPADEDPGPLHGPAGRRPYPLEVNASVLEGRLRIAWSYSHELHRRSEVEQLASAFTAQLEELMEHAKNPEVEAMTGADFGDASLEDDELAAIFEQLGGGDDATAAPAADPSGRRRVGVS